MDWGDESERWKKDDNKMKKKLNKGKTKKTTPGKASKSKCKKSKVKLGQNSVEKSPPSGKTKMTEVVGGKGMTSKASSINKVAPEDISSTTTTTSVPDLTKRPMEIPTTTLAISPAERVVDETPVVFNQPQVIIYRFLNVLVDRNRLVFDLMRYTKHNLYTFLVENWTSPELIALIDLVRTESYYDSCQNEETPVVFRTTQSTAAIQDSIVMYVIWKCYRARKTMDIGHDNPALRALLHLVMLDGLITGRLVVHIEPSILETVQRLTAGGQVKQYVYSSALTPLFGEHRLISFTNVGDLVTQFDGFFDGLQLDMRQKETYQTMVEAFQIPPSSILFVTFSETESKKAARTGMHVAKICQQRQKMPKYCNIKVISSIANIRFQEAAATPATATTNNTVPAPASQ